MSLRIQHLRTATVLGIGFVVALLGAAFLGRAVDRVREAADRAQ